MASILIVDDDRNTRLLYVREMAEEGYDVFPAADAREALEFFRLKRPDLVVLDIRMPGMDGLELLAKMLSIDRKVPIVLLSAFSVYRDNFLSWAADAYVSKSADTSELKRTVSGLISSPGTALGRPRPPELQLHGHL
jgi:two-component system, response regulator, stage 0 sporulation protein F